MARVLILRDIEAARRAARLVEARGHEPLILPLQTIGPLVPELPPGPFRGLLLTSANAVPYLERHFGPGAPPILTVGTATTEAVEAAGLPVAAQGEGNGADLARLAARLGGDGPLLYLAGRVRTSGLEDGLEAGRIPCRTIEVYDTIFREPDDREIAAATAGRPVDAVLLLSLGQARAYRALCARRPRVFDPPPLALCLSGRIRAELECQDGVVADRPELSALLDRYEAASSARH